MRDPAFWWTGPSAAAALLSPAAACYGAIAARRMAQPGFKAAAPVICVGNFTVGGAGKTPTAMALARILLQWRRRPFFLSRGYGGRVAGPVRIDQGAWTAADVGDEPLLLARVAPAIVAHNRPAGVKAAVAAGADTVIMDDGLQNPSVAKDFALAVVDGRRGIGNGRIFPAGPLRAPLAAQLDYVSAVLLVGTASPAADPTIAAARKRGLPVFHGDLQPTPDAVAALAGKPVLAFAGIADPGKFFATLEAHGIPVAIRRPFSDHRPYTANDVAELMACAARNGLTLVTTEKDMARLRGDPAAAELAARATVLPVTLEFNDVAGLEEMLLRTIRERAAY
jgi:tetraacyldisaccharide 4'-kinase